MEEILNTKTRDELIAALVEGVDAVLESWDTMSEFADLNEDDTPQSDREAYVGESSLIILRNRRRALAELDADG